MVGINQIIIANGDVKAKQYVDCNTEILKELIENVQKNISSEMSYNDIQEVKDKLNEIKDVTQSNNIKEKLKKISLNSIKAIKGTAEFSAAVVALIEFIKNIIK